SERQRLELLAGSPAIAPDVLAVLGKIQDVPVGGQREAIILDTVARGNRPRLVEPLAGGEVPELDLFAMHVLLRLVILRGPEMVDDGERGAVGQEEDAIGPGFAPGRDREAMQDGAAFDVAELNVLRLPLDDDKRLVVRRQLIESYVAQQRLQGP